MFLTLPSLVIVSRAVFGNKRGVPVCDISEDEEEEDDLVLMRKQFAMRAAAARAKV